MKRPVIPFILTVLLCGMLAASCTRDYKGDIDALQGRIDALSQQQDKLNGITDNLGALRDVLLIGASGDPVVSVTPNGDGFDFTFKNNGTKHVGTATGGVSVGSAPDVFFWTIGGEPLKDAAGNNAAIEVSPRFRVADGGIKVSTDDGKTWTAIQPAADGVITNVEDNASSVIVSLLGGESVSFARELPLQVKLSGDGSTIPSQGKVVVDYYITGGSGSYEIATSQPNGWSPQIREENSFKGQMVFVSSGEPVSDEVRVFVSDDGGHLVAYTLNLSTLTPDENFPLLLPAYEAYNVASAGGNVEVTVNTNLDYEIEIEPSAGSWLTCVGVKAAYTEKITFSAAANDDMQMRIAKVTLSAGEYEKTVMICQDGKLPTVGQNLSENGTANCYIVPTAGDYYFDATVIGNGQAGIIEGVGFHTEDAAITPVDVDILNELTDATVIENLRLEDGKVCFHATGAKGNITVGVFDDEESILWSWHLWFTDMPSEKVHTIDDGRQFVLMDRNLGATGAGPEDGEDAFGLFYQWGRKDPFDGQAMFERVTSNTAGTLEYAIKRPHRPLKTSQSYTFNWMNNLNDYLWGNADYHGLTPFGELVKTIYDPCPAGYMVPPAYTFMILKDNSRLEFITNGILVRGDYGQVSFYPYAGRVYESSWEAFGHNQEEIYAAVWNSCPAIYNTSVYDGGACSYFRVSKLEMAVNIGDIRARGIPVRCVKQQK